MLDRRSIFAAAVAAAPLLVAWHGASAAADMTEGEATAFIQQLGEQSITVLRASGLTLEQRETRLRALLRNGFDFPFLGRFVLGNHWRKATLEQRGDYQRLFGEYVLKVYTSRFGGYAGESFTIVGARQAGKTDVLVSTRIDRPSGPPLSGAWRVRRIDNRPRIIDVMIQGVSMAVTQRSEFAAVITRSGLDGLIEALRARTGKMPAAA